MKYPTVRMSEPRYRYLTKHRHEKVYEVVVSFDRLQEAEEFVRRTSIELADAAARARKGDG